MTAHVITIDSTYVGWWWSTEKLTRAYLKWYRAWPSVSMAHAPMHPTLTMPLCGLMTKCWKTNHLTAAYCQCQPGLIRYAGVTGRWGPSTSCIANQWRCGSLAFCPHHFHIHHSEWIDEVNYNILFSICRLLSMCEKWVFQFHWTLYWSFNNSMWLSAWMPGLCLIIVLQTVTFQ